MPPLELDGGTRSSRKTRSSLDSIKAPDILGSRPELFGPPGNRATVRSQPVGRAPHSDRHRHVLWRQALVRFTMVMFQRDISPQLLVILLWSGGEF